MGRGLIVAGIPAAERRGLSKKKAAKLLHWTLVQDVLVECAGGFVASTTEPLLQAILQEWRRRVGSDEADAQPLAQKEHESQQDRTRHLSEPVSREDSCALTTLPCPLSPLAECDEDESSASPSDVSVCMPRDKCARDEKFEALD